MELMLYHGSDTTDGIDRLAVVTSTPTKLMVLRVLRALLGLADGVDGVDGFNATS